MTVLFRNVNAGCGFGVLYLHVEMLVEAKADQIRPKAPDNFDAMVNPCEEMAHVRTFICAMTEG